MKTLIALIIFLALASSAAAQVSGHLQTIDDKSVLTVWGTHSERGHAQGYLLGDGINTMFDDYMIDYLCGGSAFVYGMLRAMYTANYDADPKYEDEAAGMLDGMVDAGYSLYNETLGRDVDVTDILTCNALVDLSFAVDLEPIACSSLSSWGTSTLIDPLLAGNHIITRHLDWTKHWSLTKTALIIVHLPSEADEQPWLSMGYPAVMGVLSGINQSGVGAFLNVGNYAGGSAGAPFHPMLLSVRNGIEAADYDGIGGCTPEDVTAAIEDRSRFGGYIIHTTKNDGASSNPIVIECNNSAGVDARDITDNTVVPGDNLLATNHFRVLYPPVYCSRYDRVVNELNVSTDISPERSWQIMAEQAGQFGSNIQAMQYIASADRLYWATDTLYEPAYMQPPTLIDLDQLFGYPTDVEATASVLHLHQSHPNPCRSTTEIAFTTSSVEPSRAVVRLYDPAGRLVRTLTDAVKPAGTHAAAWDGTDDRGVPVASGVYLYMITQNGESRTRRLVVLR